MNDTWNSDELREEEEIQRILDEQDALDSEWAHQQSLDEEQDRLTQEEQKELTLWHLEGCLHNAINQYGLQEVQKLVAKVTNLITANSLPTEYLDHH